MNRKRLLTILTLVLSFTITSSLAFATVTYVMNKTVDESVIVGDTAVYSDGLIVELATYDNHTLTFYELAETETMKHSITYTYNYTILVDGMSIEVSSLSNDITVTELTYTDTTISITFSLNQEMEFESGSILAVQFYFEAVESTAININTATIDELLSIGFSESEAAEIVALEIHISSLIELYYNVYIIDYITRFQPLVDDGSIVFE
jgi:DNA uptake protein ComE-like DNA-binding protein